MNISYCILNYIKRNNKDISVAENHVNQEKINKYHIGNDWKRSSVIWHVYCYQTNERSINGQF
jgi:hypothetical protein